MLKITAEEVNFIIYYEIDDQDVKTVLRMAEHGGDGGDGEGSWVLLARASRAGGSRARRTGGRA